MSRLPHVRWVEASGGAQEEAWVGQLCIGRVSSTGGVFFFLPAHNDPWDIKRITRGWEEPGKKEAKTLLGARQRLLTKLADWLQGAGLRQDEEALA